MVRSKAVCQVHVCPNAVAGISSRRLGVESRRHSWRSCPARRILDLPESGFVHGVSLAFPAAVVQRPDPEPIERSCVRTKCFIICLWSLPLLATLQAADSGQRLHFPAAGFSIAPLDAPVDQATRQAVVMLLPAIEGFSANVNVQIQPYSGSLEEYRALTQKQFKEAAVKVIVEKKLGKSVVIYEYSGEIRGQLVHCYARAVKSGEHVYLATATAAEAQWPKQSARLKACVDSFRCDAEEKVAAP